MKIINADCIEAMKAMDDNSIDSIVTDPPYELSNDGKSSTNRVLFEVMFPENAKLDAVRKGECQLPFFVNKVLGLSDIGTIPTPTTTMPISSVTFDDEVEGRNVNVINGKEGSVNVADNFAGFNTQSETAEHLGSFTLELADFTHFFNVLNGIGLGFYASGLGVGFRVDSTSFPSLNSSSTSIVLSDDDIRFRNDALTNLASAFTGTGSGPVFGFDLTRGAVENFSADGARLFAAILLATGAKIVRADSATSNLPSMLEARRISVVDDATNRAFSFDLIIHTPNLASTGFMGKSWDGSKIAFNVEVWREALRVLKPGGHLLAFSGSRTYHRMAVAIEDAGFEIRDQIMWIYGSGFPKSLNIAKAIDKANDFEGKVIGKGTSWNRPDSEDGNTARMNASPGEYDIKELSEEAAEWQGWGTALKPAHEPMVLARKPLIGTVAANVIHYGTGGLNIDGGRVGNEGGTKLADEDVAESSASKTVTAYGNGLGGPFGKPVAGLGRFPANVIHDGSDEVVGLFPQSKGMATQNSGENIKVYTGNSLFHSKTEFPPVREGYNDNGSAARFFYCAKASKRDRNEGLDDFEAKRDHDGREDGRTGENNPRNRTNTPKVNHHPTVKPVDLMRYLCRLITPPNGIVLDPFMGSGSTGKGAVYEGFDFIGIDQSAEYCEIANARINFAIENRDEDLFS